MNGGESRVVPIPSQPDDWAGKCDNMMPKYILFAGVEVSPEPILAGSAKIRPRARLVRLIGEELISDEAVAIVELVKNSYDADARNVNVRFEGKNPLNPERIVVEDDGCGMDLKVVESSWLELGTTSKLAGQSSPDGRQYQGAKGIGRFAAARLARNLLLESKLKGIQDGITVLLDWGRFDDASYLEDIDVSYEVGPMWKKTEGGTKLTMEGIREPWTRERVEELHSRLSRLVSPFNEISDFQINLEIPSFHEFSGPIQAPEVTIRPKYVLKGTLNTDGHFDGEIHVDGALLKKIDSVKRGRGDSFPACGPFEVEIRAWDRDRDGLEGLANELNSSVAVIRKTLNAYCGVSIYRDGFRVHPYGQTGNDWLNLDLRSRQNPGLKLANNQIIGAIKISKNKNPELKDRSTREGLVLNAEYADLNRWFKEVISLLEEERYRLRPRKEESESSSSLFEPFEIGATLNKAKLKVGAGTPLGKELGAIEDQVKKGVDRLQETFSRVLMQAGLGHMVDIVIHEIGRPLGKLSRETSALDQNYPQHLPERISPIFVGSLTKMKGWLVELQNLRQRLDTQTPALRGRTTAFNVKDEIQDNLALFSAMFQKQKISCKFIAPKHPVNVRMSRAVLGQVVANLLDNSIYWLDRTRGGGKGGDILVEIKEIPSGFIVRVSDSGPGVEEQDRERIFEPYFSKKPDGMGLGLYIARLVMDPYGRVLYQPEGDLPGACFEAIFERGVGK